MSTTGQIFTLFFAVIYGALFTISDRWRPFFMSHKSQEGIRRIFLSLIFFGVIPVIYFVFTFFVLAKTVSDGTFSSILSPLAAVLFVMPLGAFYLIWLWIVIPNKEKFYSGHELKLEPVSNSFHWLDKNEPITFAFASLMLTIFLFVPLIVLILVLFKVLCI